VPAEVAFIAGSATPGTRYDESSHRVLWRGGLDPGAGQNLSFAMHSDPLAAAGTVVTLTAGLRDGLGQSWSRAVSARLLGSALANSQIQASAQFASPGESLTYTIQIRNIGRGSGYRSAIPGTGLILNPESLWVSSGVVEEVEPSGLHWSGIVAAESLVLLRYQARIAADAQPGHP